MILATNSKLAFCENVQFGFGREPFTTWVLGAAENNTKPSAAARDVNAKERTQARTQTQKFHSISTHIRVDGVPPPLFFT